MKHTMGLRFVRLGAKIIDEFVAPILWDPLSETAPNVMTATKIAKSPTRRASGPLNAVTIVEAGQDDD